MLKSSLFETAMRMAAPVGAAAVVRVPAPFTTMTMTMTITATMRGGYG